MSLKSDGRKSGNDADNILLQNQLSTVFAVPIPFAWWLPGRYDVKGFNEMSGAAYIGLLVVLGGGLALLTWVGWRFFMAPLPVAEGMPVAPCRTERAHRVAGVDQGADWFQRFGWMSLKGVWSVMAAFLIGGGVVAGVFSVSEWIAPDPLAATEMERQAHIQAALNPERLVPPPALPPSMFVGSERPALETADRDWSKLDPRFTQTVLRMLARLNERGYPFALLEGYRSPERQEKLADLGTHVTNARAFQSKHQFGLAVDLAPVNDGRLVISERDPWAMKAYVALGEEAEKAGLTWGGRWSFKDYGHIELAAAVAVNTSDAK
jgi:peptidoglycan L-alanyl-D-glutamate endopeptidase CwlK